MDKDEEFQLTAKRLKELGQKRLTLEEKKRIRRSLVDMNIPTFHQYLNQNQLELKRDMTTIFQMNIGLYCNQACNHCHVESSPKRAEMLDRKTAEQCLNIIRNSPGITTLDITGGAPELNSQFRFLVEEGHKMGLEVIDRCNLTVLEEPGQEDLPDFLSKHKVRVVASLPCYSKKNVNIQRGAGVFERSIRGLQTLNEYGYGKANSGLSLDLVYNPLGGFLPPNQTDLEAKYKEELMEHFGIEFNSLFTLANMPIKRFADFLHRRHELNGYMDLLVRNFNNDTVDGLMCRNTVSIGYDGAIYDCDFNQQLALHVKEGKKELNVFDIQSVQELHEKIRIDNHCYGCTAGMGSSCQGATV